MLSDRSTKGFFLSKPSENLEKTSCVCLNCSPVLFKASFIAFILRLPLARIAATSPKAASKFPVRAIALSRAPDKPPSPSSAINPSKIPCSLLLPSAFD